MPFPVFAPDTLYKAYQTSKGQSVDDGRCRARTLFFASRWTHFLTPADREIEENRRFPYLMMEPVDLNPEGSGEVLVLTHGLNEGSPAKLFPWAYNLTMALQMPVLIFPMAFHIARRSALWGFSPQARVAAERSGLPGNRKASPFNAQISARLFEAPERFYTGGLQSYYDTIDLHDRIFQGDHPGCRPGARLHFLGYSAGGYLALILLLADAQARFAGSRGVVFASCADLDGMHPDSIFIMDAAASDRLMAFLGERRYENLLPDARLAPLIEAPRYWMTQLFFHGPALTDRLNALNPRLMAVSSPMDRVVTAEGMARNLTPVRRLSLDLGIHEFPFNLPDPLLTVYDRRQEDTRALLSAVRDGHTIPPAYRAVFETFIGEIAAFLRPSR
jgi:hypothetical protein